MVHPAFIMWCTSEGRRDYLRRLSRAIERLRRDFGGVRVGRRTLSEILDGAIALRPLGRARGCDKGGDAEEEGVAAKLAPHAHRNGRGAPGSQHIKPPTSPRAEDEFWVYCY